MKIGYVLSGGGARGFAHLGVLQLLDEMKLTPYAISGTSVGAVIGALYASGKAPCAILELAKNNSYLGWSKLLWHRSGLFSADGLKSVLSTAIEKDDFAALKTKLFVTATDLNKGESVIFSEGSLFDAVIASAAIPVFSAPVSIGSRVLVDGGLLNNFPVTPLVAHCNAIIGSHVNKLKNGMENTSIFEAFDIIERCFHIAIANSVYSNVSKCDLFIEPPLDRFSMFDIKHADEIFELGYKAALKHKVKIEKIRDKT